MSLFGFPKRFGMQKTILSNRPIMRTQLACFDRTLWPNGTVSTKFH